MSRLAKVILPCAIVAGAAAAAAPANALELDAPASVQVTEGTTAKIVVNRSGGRTKRKRGRVAAETGTADGSDFIAPGARALRFKKGKRKATISVDTVEDALDEPDETLTMRFSLGRKPNVARAETELTIADDDPGTEPPFSPPAISLANAALSEGGGTVYVPVLLSDASSRAASVNYTTQNGTALAGAEYTQASGTLVIPAGATSSVIPVELADDAKDEDDKALSLVISDPVDATIGDGDAAVQISDNDPPPVLSINDVALTEQATNAVFTISLSAVSEKQITVQVSTTNGTAIGGALCGGTTDYLTLTNLNVVISPGQANKTFNVGVCEDVTTELIEGANVTLSNPTNATLGDATALLTINDDD